MKIMKLMMSSVLALLIAPSGLIYSSGDMKDVKEESAVSTAAISKKYPLLSQHQLYQDWLRARKPEEKAVEIGYFFDGENFFCDETICKNSQDRDDYFKEVKAFLEENRKILSELKYLEYVKKLKQFHDELAAVKQRHAARHQMPAGLEQAIKDGDSKFVFEHLDKHPEDMKALDEDGNNPLILALDQEKWNVPMVEQLIKRTKDLNFKNDEGETALHKAALENNVATSKIIKLLVSKGATPDARDDNGNMPIVYAARAVNVPAAKALLQYKISLDKVTSPNSAIMIEAIQGLPTGKNEVCPRCKEVHPEPTEQEQIELLTLLAKHGADMNATDTKGDTPLVQAIRVANAPVVKFLLDHKADIQARSNGQLPLDRAVFSYSMLDYAMDSRNEDEFTKLKKQAFAVIELLVERGARIDSSAYWTPMMEALNNGSFLIVKLLVEHNATIPEQIGGQPTMDVLRSRQKQAETKAKQQEYENIIEYLVKRSPERAQSSGMQEQTAAVAALPEDMKKHKEITAMLEQFTAGPTRPSKVTLNNIKRAFVGDYSKELGNYDPVFDKIINEDVSVLELQDEAKDTPLLLAIKYNKPDAVATILTLLESLKEEQKAKLLHKVISHINQQGFDAYHLAKELGYDDIVKLLEPYNK